MKVRYNNLVLKFKPEDAGERMALGRLRGRLPEYANASDDGYGNLIVSGIDLGEVFRCALMGKRSKENAVSSEAVE